MGLLGFVFGLLGLDLFLKGKMEGEKPEDFPRDMEGTGGRIKLYRNHNEGFCFGFLKKRRDLVTMVPLIFTSAASGVLLFLLPRKGETVRKLGFSMIVAGGISNLYDRLVRGYVVDYFSIQIGFLKKVVFNLADIFIFAGALLVSLRDIFKD